MKNRRKEYYQNGFTVLKHICSPHVITPIYQDILQCLEECALELGCTLQEYLMNVSRWAHPSLVTDGVLKFIETELKKLISNFFGEEVKLAKINIISKSAYAIHSVPCHQDIAYSPSDPYQFSLWLPLQAVNINDGPLEVLPGSHLSKIEPAIDFWAPNFIDNIYLSLPWQKNFRILPLELGDAILFDSRIWHRSGPNVSKQFRFALVTRWRQPGIQYSNIPEKKPAFFGMWNCGTLTESLLEQGLNYFYKEKVICGYSHLIEVWQQLLKEKKLPFPIDYIKVQRDLNDLFILQRAFELHNGGDAQGVVYPKLWHTLLKPLSQWLKYHA